MAIGAQGLSAREGRVDPMAIVLPVLIFFRGVEDWGCVAFFFLGDGSRRGGGVKVWCLCGRVVGCVVFRLEWGLRRASCVWVESYVNRTI